jgi:hypothetical protein
MNLRYILSHLQEAEEQLQDTIEAIQMDPSYDEGEFYVAMQHIYNHLNRPGILGMHYRNSLQMKARRISENGDNFPKTWICPPKIFSPSASS